MVWELAPDHLNPLSLAQSITFKIPLYSYIFESSPSNPLHDISLSHYTEKSFARTHND
jgi:hypothetical protein